MEDFEAKPLEGVLDVALEQASADEVKVADIMENFGHRGFGPLLTIFGLLAISPLAAIPGIPSLLGVSVILIAAQLLVGRRHPWLPTRLKELGFERAKLARVRAKSDGWLRRIDKIVTQRIAWATGPIATRLAAGACIALAGMMVPLELLPFAAALPGITIILFGLSLTARDGLLMALSFALAGATIFFALKWLL